MVDYPVNDVSEDMSFLEMLDVLNDDLVRKGEDPIAFDHDCREGICGPAACSSTARRTARPVDHHLPIAHAQVQGWRHHPRGALACRHSP
jgi:succinate dehydrogenase/fumarate reductase-like Fe-S protein